MTRRIRIDLSPLDEDFAQASVAASLPLADGIYTVEVHTVELTQTRRSARPMLCWTLRVLAPDHAADRRLWRNQVLVPHNLGWLKRDLHLCGLHLDKLSDLPDQLPRLTGIVLEVVKRTHGDYDSVTFRRRASAP
jgi:hypothetical protein